MVEDRIFALFQHIENTAKTELGNDLVEINDVVWFFLQAFFEKIFFLNVLNTKICRARR